MVEYSPKLRNKGLRPPFGYFVSPIDPDILLPDVKKLEALEYAFRMRAKHKTSFINCVVWLHAQTGQRMTIPGFSLAYKRWVKQVRKRNGNALAIERKKLEEQKKKLLEQNYAGFTVKLDDKQSVSALAYNEVNKQTW